MSHYYRHPESDCVFREDEELDMDASYDAGLCVELEPRSYVEWCNKYGVEVDLDPVDELLLRLGLL